MYYKKCAFLWIPCNASFCPIALAWGAECCPHLLPRPTRAGFFIIMGSSSMGSSRSPKFMEQFSSVGWIVNKWDRVGKSHSHCYSHHNSICEHCKGKAVSREGSWLRAVSNDRCMRTLRDTCAPGMVVMCLCSPLQLPDLPCHWATSGLLPKLSKIASQPHQAL